MIIEVMDNFLVFLAIKVIKLYQKTLSPDHSWLKTKFPHGYCRFKPTCSEYSIAAFKKYGFLKGSLLTIGRILRCNPWSRGGWDPLR
ncbi:MAG TPA: membrane protein insertion efficiency factor YidD [bacterium]|nr:membrane protein insertion efficiency factor YidD [bacterium]